MPISRKNKNLKNMSKNSKRNKTRKINNKIKGGNRKVKSLKKISLNSLLKTIDLSKINTYDDLNYLGLTKNLQIELFNKTMFISISDWRKLSNKIKQFYDNKITFSKKDDDDNYINITPYITGTQTIPAQRYYKAREGLNTNTNFLDFNGEYVDDTIYLYIQINELWIHPRLYAKNDTNQYIYYDINKVYQKLDDDTFILISGDENTLFYKKKNFYFQGLSHQMTIEPYLTQLMTTGTKNITSTEFNDLSSKNKHENNMNKVN